MRKVTEFVKSPGGDRFVPKVRGVERARILDRFARLMEHSYEAVMNGEDGTVDDIILPGDELARGRRRGVSQWGDEVDVDHVVEFMRDHIDTTGATVEHNLRGIPSACEAAAKRFGIGWPTAIRYWRARPQPVPARPAPPRDVRDQREGPAGGETGSDSAASGIAARRVPYGAVTNDTQAQSA